MPLLEQRRKPPGDASFTRRRLTRSFFSLVRHTTRHWPLYWAVVYLAGFGLGGSLPATTKIPSAIFPASARAGTLAPVLLAVIPGVWGGSVWLVVFGSGFLAGSVEAGHRSSTVSVVADQPWAPARRRSDRRAAVLRITGWPSVSGREKWRAPARIIHLGEAPSGKETLPLHDGQGVWLTGKGSPPLAGAFITGPVEFSIPQVATYPGGFDFRLFLHGRGLRWQGRLADWAEVPRKDPVAWASVRLLHPAREYLLGSIQDRFPAEEGEMAAAVLLGLRTAGSRRASRPYADLGLAHLFAVSGLHVGILLGIILLPGKLAGVGPGARLLPLAFLLPLYVLLTGIPGSVVRAASIGFLAGAAGVSGRPMDPLRVVGLLFWAGTVWHPAQNLDVGLKLSYLAAGGILGVSSLTGGFRFGSNRVAGTLAAGVAVSLAAQWFTLPVVASSFGRVSLLSPLANLVAVPVFGLAVWCVVLSLVLGPLWSGGAESMAALGWIILRSLSALARLAAGISGGFSFGMPPPGLGAHLIWGLLTLVGLGSLRRIQSGRLGRTSGMTILAGTLTAGLLVFGPVARELDQPDRVTVWQFDVGQGDCGLLVFPDGWSLMIDTAGRFGFGSGDDDGPLARNVVPFLQRQGISKIDAVVLTHGHLDHMGGSRILARTFRVGEWHVAGRARKAVPAMTDSLRVHHTVAGQVLHRWREWEVAVLHPPLDPPEHLHENDYSLVVVLRRKSKNVAVWSGDLETAGEEILLRSGRAPEEVQVWKAGHHGSDTSGSQAWLDLMKPELILVSCGVGNGYGHPSHGPYVVEGDTLGLVRTDLAGSLRLEWDLEGNMTWKTVGPAGRDGPFP